MAEGGSFGTFNQAVGARGSSGRFNYAFNVAHYRADDVPVTPYNLLPPGFSRFDNSYDNWSFSTKLGADLSRDFTVNFVARYTDARLFYTADDPNAFPTYPNNFQSRQDTQQFYTRGEAVWRAFGGDVVSYFGINYADLHSDNRDINLTTFGDGERVEYDWRSVVKAAPGYTVVVGAKHQNEQLTVPDLFAEEWSRGAFVEAQTEPLRNLFVVANARIDDNENFGSHATWRLAPAYVIESTGTKIKGSVGTAFKAPTLSQRFQDFPDFLFFANPDLQPEESIGYDVGFEQAVLGGHVQFGATYFHNDLTQLIQSAFDPLTFRSTLVNIGSAKTEGVEVFASADITDDIRVRADYTYTEATNEDTGAWLQRRSRHKASFNVGWTPTDKLLLTGSVLFYGESLDLDRSTFGPTILPSFTVVNVGADYKLNDNMSLYGRIDNLFDERYEIPDGFEATGIGGYVGIRFTN
jgi:vitamin B12 transporter